MANQKEGVYENVISCAKKEFLSKGFLNASLRNIATDAHTTTGSIYTRFGNKEGLFRAIVQPVVDSIKKLFLKIEEDFTYMNSHKQKEELVNYSKTSLLQLVDFIYDNFVEFQLLLDGSYGTCFRDFLDDLVNIEVEYTYKYMNKIGCKSVEEGIVTEDLIHMVTRSFFDGLFEIVRHKMQKEDALKYVDLLQKYHQRGYEVFLNPEYL